MPFHRHVCFAEPDGPVERITDDAVAAARRHVERRIGAIRAAVLAAEDADAALRALIDLAADWTPDAFGALVDQALTLAALTGRDDVMNEIEGAAAFAEPDFTRREFREQIEFLTQKRPTVSRIWTDFMQGQHDRALVVAGVTDQAMIDEFATAIIDSARTYDRRAFAAEFDRLVAKYGWEYNGGREWRIRTIFETNIRTSYMAGRLKQMRDPDVVRLRPYWQYRHAATRMPLNPREEHVAWDGLVLDWDDPWWEVYYPPNDWKCSCGVTTLSRGDLRRLGKTGPDPSPEIVRRPYLHKASGEVIQLPDGTGFGWDYMPGDQWERGLVPSALLDDPAAVPVADSSGRHLVSIDTPEPIEDLVARARPFSEAALAATERLRNLVDPSPETLVRGFLDPFGADIDRGVLWTDVAGHRVPISDQYFRTASGRWKIDKRDRGHLTPLLAETLMDPDEIWIGLFDRADEIFVDRRYIRVTPELGGFIVMELGRRWWREVTAFAPDRNGVPNLASLDARRGGRLLWRRK